MALQAAAIEPVRLTVRDLRCGGECGGVTREGLCGVQIAGLRAEADGVEKQVLDLPDVFRIVGERICQRGQRLR